MGNVDSMDKAIHTVLQPETIPEQSFTYDIKCMDWGEYLKNFSHIASNIHNYHNELSQALSDIDLQLCDIMHYIELYNMDEEDSIRMIRLLKECREQRRDIKDEMLKVEYFQKAIGTSSNISRAKESIKQIGKLSTRIYHPRKLQELFKDNPQKTLRESRLMRAFDGSTCIDVDNKDCADIDLDNANCADNEQLCIEQNSNEDSEVIQYSKQETVFDGKENDWKQFAKQQEEFYNNVNQYIYNQQSDLSDIDNEIEQILKEIETANYNVTQGYKVYKNLKELRNKKSKLQKELDCLYILTSKFDCSVMAESMRSCISEIEDVMSGSVGNNSIQIQGEHI